MDAKVISLAEAKGWSAPPSSPVSGANFYGAEMVQNAANLSPDLTLALTTAVKELSSLLSRLVPAGRADGVTVLECVNDFLRAKARQNRSDRYLRQLRVSLSSFVKGRWNRPLESVTIKDLEAWLDAQDWEPATQKSYLIDVSSMLNWAQRRGLVTSNPARAVELPDPEDLAPAIHKPEEVRAVLELARAEDLDVCRCLAVRYFAGLRTAEVHRLEESLIREGFIEVPARIAKTRARRLVPIPANLKAWLALGGTLPITQANGRMADFTHGLAKKRRIAWPSNVTRHSWCSYRLAQSQNAALVALEAGHSEQMLFQHYRELVTPQASAEYWSIFPNL